MEILLLACIFAFMAGLIDAIAGGGGLIQVPGLIFLFPQMPIVTLLGTNKLASSCGTVMSSFHYVKTMKIDFKALIPAILSAIFFSVIGAKIVSTLNNEILKPIIFVLIILIGIYTLFKKNFGLHSHLKINGTQLKLVTIFLAGIMGFYDGFFGPGTGSLLIFGFVSLIGYSFLEGSAYAKLLNLSANVAALAFFAVHGKIVYSTAIPMAVFNVLGNLTGAKLAIRKGSGFVRWVFLIVISGILIELIQKISA